MSWLEIRRHPSGQEAVIAIVDGADAPRRVNITLQGSAILSVFLDGNSVTNSREYLLERERFAAMLEEALGLIERTIVLFPELISRYVNLLGVEFFGGPVGAMRWIARIDEAARQAGSRDD